MNKKYSVLILSLFVLVLILFFVIFINEKNQGNAEEQYALGMDYYKGQNIEGNYEKAFKLFSKSAKQGNSDANMLLGSMYLKGIGVAKDYSKAIEYIHSACKFGLKGACDLYNQTKRND